MEGNLCCHNWTAPLASHCCWGKCNCSEGKTMVIWIKSSALMNIVLVAIKENIPGHPLCKCTRSPSWINLILHSPNTTHPRSLAWLRHLTFPREHSWYWPDTMSAWLGPTVWMLPMMSLVTNDDDDVIISDHCCHVTSVSAGSRHTLLGSAELDSAPMLQPSRWQDPGQYRPIRDRCWGQPANQRRLRGEGTILGAAIDRIPARLLREQRPVTPSGGWEDRRPDRAGTQPHPSSEAAIIIWWITGTSDNNDLPGSYQED